MSGAVKKFGHKYIGGKMANRAAGKLNLKTELSSDDLDRFKAMSKDAAEAISKKLLPQHHLQAHKAAPKKVPEPEFSGVQMDLFDHTKAKAVGVTKQNKKPRGTEDQSTDTKSQTDPNQLSMDFNETDETSSEGPTESSKSKTISEVKKTAKAVAHNSVKTQGAPQVLQDVSASGVSERLQTVPGIGQALAQAIIDHGGPFHSAADLEKVHNIGPKLSKRIWEEL